MRCPKCGDTRLITVLTPGRTRGQTFGCLGCGWIKKNKRRKKKSSKAA